MRPLSLHYHGAVVRLSLTTWFPTSTIRPKQSSTIDAEEHVWREARPEPLGRLPVGGAADVKPRPPPRHRRSFRESRTPETPRWPPPADVVRRDHDRVSSAASVDPHDVDTAAAFAGALVEGGGELVDARTLASPCGLHILSEEHMAPSSRSSAVGICGLSHLSEALAPARAVRHRPRRLHAPVGNRPKVPGRGPVRSSSPAPRAPEIRLGRRCAAPDS
jgi:hypothetical protein